MRGDKISQERLYCFSLYCEGNLQTKSFAFATVRKSEKEAKKAAMNELKQKFPPEDGWRNYDMSYLVVPDETILFIAKLISGARFDR